MGKIPIMTRISHVLDQGIMVDHDRSHAQITVFYRQTALLGLLVIYNSVFIGCAVFLQYLSGESPSVPGSAVDVFTGAVLWMISVTAILFFIRHIESRPRALLWLVISAAAGALAIDEIFEFHERTWQLVGDDDYIKIVFWCCAIFGSYILYKVEKPTRIVFLAFVSGLLFQTIYLIVDMGDGDFFSLPISETVLDWAEEILETLAMQAYLAGLLLHFTFLTFSTHSEKVSVE